MLNRSMQAHVVFIYSCGVQFIGFRINTACKVLSMLDVHPPLRMLAMWMRDKRTFRKRTVMESMMGMTLRTH